MICGRLRKFPLITASSVMLVAIACDVYASEGATQIGWLSQTVRRSLPLTYLDQPQADEGLQGARLGIADNNTTGKFTGQSFELVESIAPQDGDVPTALRALTTKGIRLVVTDLDAPKLISVSTLSDAADLTFFNAGARDDRLRAEDCRPNILHLLPSRAMLADALLQ